VRLLDELELSPNTSFEHDLVHDMESVSVTADSMRAVKRYNDEVLSLSSSLLHDAMLARYIRSLVFVCYKLCSTEMAKCRIMQTVQHDSPGTLVC